MTKKEKYYSNGIVVGLIKGRHEMPVNTYIFESIENVLDYVKMEHMVTDWLIRNVGIETTYGCGINQNDYADVEVFRGKAPLTVYVTGLTAVTATLIKVCAMNGIELRLMHYDAVNGNYVPQYIF